MNYITLKIFNNKKNMTYLYGTTSLKYMFVPSKHLLKYDVIISFCLSCLSNIL